MFHHCCWCFGVLYSSTHALHRAPSAAAAAISIVLLEAAAVLEVPVVVNQL